MINNPFDDYDEKEIFTFYIWELSMMIKVGELHIENFKQENKNFKDDKKRPKGIDTVFYELNVSDWKERLEKSLMIYKLDYGHEYSVSDVRFPKK